MAKPRFNYIHESHLDLFWIGDYRFCLERGRHVIKQYVDRCLECPDETFLLETVVFLEHFLKEHPDYEDAVKKLWAEGRLDVGAAYVDVLEHLVPGESQIRNIVRGRRWCRDRLGIDTRLAAHADLPSLSPQMPQIYRRAGVQYYSTSRKVFPHGQVWMHVAPDGTKIGVFNHPLHYDFHELRRNAEALNADRGWGKYLDPAAALKGFPLGTVVLSAGAGDQADMECFAKRYGKPAREFVEDYRQAFPEFEFGFGTVSAMMREYDGQEELLPHLKGEIPSVWGMTSVTSAFFQAGRRLEGTLLTAEFLASLGQWYGLPPIADVRDEWYGTLYERLYFLGRDPVARGGELDELWKMHVFVCDHNFSGNFASQTAFDKRTIQERALRYAGEMVEHGLGLLAGEATGGEGLLVFNPLNWTRTEPIELELPAGAVEDGLGARDRDGRLVPWQVTDEAPGRSGMARVVLLPTVPAAGYAVLTLGASGEEAQGPGPQVRDDGRTVAVHTDRIALAVDKHTGAVTGLADCRTGAEWGSEHAGRLYAVREGKFDVPLGVDEADVIGVDEVRAVEPTASGPLFATVTITRSILKAHVEQRVTVWQAPVDAVDLRTTILWHGERRVQMRLWLPSAGAREAVWYGTPFYGNNWLGVVPGSGPRNPDEMASLEHWNDYRELQLWVYQKRGDAALCMSSLHPTYHWGEAGLEAVLMRTTPSCADDRFFWEHAGRREYAFRFRFAGDAADLGVPARMGQEALCPLVARTVSGDGLAEFPAGRSFIGLGGDGLILSAVHPAEDGDGVIVRFFDAAGRAQTATVRVEGAASLERVDLLGTPLGGGPTCGDTAEVAVRPYEIVTMRVRR